MMKVYKGQSMIEYAVITACFIAALTVMSVYLKRGLSGMWKDQSDRLGTIYSSQNTEYNERIIQEGTTVTRSIPQKYDTTGDGVYDRLLMETYSVTGPADFSIIINQGTGNEQAVEIIPADPNRSPMKTRTVRDETTSGQENLWD